MSRFAPWPTPALSRPAEPVGAVDDRVRAVWDEMVAAMYDTPGIVGLAAPQLGHSLRLAVADCSQTRDAALRLADPEILHASEELRRHREGSPHLPGVWAEIARPAAVRLAFTDETGARVERDFDGLWATCLQHQIDHLEGRMFFDRLSKLKRDRLLAKHAKQRRRGTG